MLRGTSILNGVKSRMAVEMAFGRLKRRWRSLKHRTEHTIKAICHVVVACVNNALVSVNAQVKLYLLRIA